MFLRTSRDKDKCLEFVSSGRYGRTASSCRLALAASRMRLSSFLRSSSFSLRFKPEFGVVPAGYGAAHEWRFMAESETGGHTLLNSCR